MWCVLLWHERQGLYIQMVGRGLRCAPGKHDCVVLDQGGCTLLHGPVCGPGGYVPEPWHAADATHKRELVRFEALYPSLPCRQHLAM